MFRLRVCGRGWDPWDVWEVARSLEPTLLQKIPQGPLGDFSARKLASKLVSTIIEFGFHSL